MQSKRHFADYDPDYRVGKSEVTADINDARDAIDRFLETRSRRRHEIVQIRACGMVGSPLPF